MARSRTDEQAPLQGVKFLDRLQPLLARLRSAGCERDRAGNRQLFFDQVCGLILLTFFNPSLKSLRDLQGASRLKQVRKKLGCQAASLGSLSEALHVFDPQLLVGIIEELLGELPQSPTADPRWKSLSQIPVAVDGTLLRQLPQITQACFQSRRDRGWKLHTHFEVLRGVACCARLTDASGQGAASEKAVLRRSLEPDHCYITDRGYEEMLSWRPAAATCAVSATIITSRPRKFANRRTRRVRRECWKIASGAWDRPDLSVLSIPIIRSDVWSCACLRIPNA
jgi:hypothetical protein